MSSPNKDYYKILQIDRRATPAAIDAAYRRLARKYNPDINKSANAPRKLRQLNEAYNTLRDRDKREKYDRSWQSLSEGRKDENIIAGNRAQSGSTNTKPSGQIITGEPGNGSSVSKRSLAIGAVVVGLVAIVAYVLFSARLGSNSTPAAPSSATASIGAASPATPGGSQTVKTASGLQYADIVVGSGDSPKPGQTVSVHYTGRLTNGTKFDSSLDRGQPFQFVIGMGQVIKGWDEGVMSMKVGGKRQLTIPPELGYGAQGAGNTIPPNSTLIFDVELLSVTAAAVPPITSPLPVPTVTAENTLTPEQIGAAVCTGERLAARRTDYAAPDDMKIDPAKSYLATIETVKGTIRAELYPKLAPKHVNSFVFLACQGFFDGLTFHRYEPGFVIQGGDPNSNGSGGPGYTLPAEFNATKHTLGILSMARTSDPNSAGSQFFIMLGDAPHLDNQYSVFGKVVEGLNVALQIRASDKMTKVNITVR